MERRISPPLWIWPNLLSLDAPLIALVWQDFLVRCYPVTLRPAARLALGLTVWAIYVADRLLDVRLPLLGRESARHAFYRKHAVAWRIVLLILLTADALVALFWVRAAMLEAGLLVAPGVLLYLAMFALPGRSKTVWKKLIAAMFFTAGVFLPEFPGNLKIALSALGFLLLCLGNLLLIENWERGVGRTRMWLWMALLCILCVLLSSRFGGPWFPAIASCSALLSLLAWFEAGIPPDARSVLADAVLLCALLFR
jgi:hypothetical protein